MTFEPPLTWLLCDDRAGNRSQCLGVAQALGWQTEIREIRYNTFARLPNSILGASFWNIDSISRQSLTAPWPQLVIAAGRRTAPIARRIKQNSQGETKIIQLMYPGYFGIAEFDLIAVPEHDGLSLKQNMMSTTGAAHALTEQRLKEEKGRWLGKLSGLSSPRIALIVGGSTKNRIFTTEMARDLGKQVSEMAVSAGGSLMISTSRRTGQQATDALMSEINAPMIHYKWGDEGENPYFGYLSTADTIIVTGDSMSMCTESCATPVPVYIYAPENLITDKHARLHKSLYDQGYARPLESGLETWQHPPLNPANDIAGVIKKLFTISER